MWPWCSSGVAAGVGQKAGVEEAMFVGGVSCCVVSVRKEDIDLVGLKPKFSNSL